MDGSQRQGVVGRSYMKSRGSKWAAEPLMMMIIIIITIIISKIHIKIILYLILLMWRIR
jgi:hypothetical protein